MTCACQVVVFMYCFNFLYGFTVFKLEVENYVMDKFTINRDSSSGYGSVNFKTGDFFEIYFCLRGETHINLSNVRYSNDGGSDVVEFSIDGIRLGVLTSPSISNYGNGWNNFIMAGPVGPNVTLSAGRHFLTVSVNKTDFYGIELDQLEIRVYNSYISEEIFKCSLFCDNDIKYSNGPSREDISSAILRRKTFRTPCINHKNVLLPIYHENVNMFLLTAMHPKYKTFENHFSEGGNCKLANHTIWEFTRLELSTSYQNISSELYSEVFAEFGSSNTSKSLFLKIKLDSSTYSHADTRLILQFYNILDIYLVSCIIKTKYGSWMTLKSFYVSPQKTKNIWIIPRNSLSDSSEIVLQVIVDPTEISSISIESIKLDYHIQESMNSSVLYSSYDTKIEVITSLSNTKIMSIRNVDTDQTFTGISEVHISHRLPWTEIYSPTVKLARTGEMNILPIAPHGLTEIPFGSSVVIGQNNLTNNTPSAEIVSIDIAPEALQLSVSFENGGSMNILIKSTWKDTKVIFKDIVTTLDPLQFPFATIMTTWNYDGNAYVDHVSTNGDMIYHIAKGWERLYGTSFTFFRQCLSRHNTQSPDLRLQLINEKDLYLYV